MLGILKKRYKKLKEEKLRKKIIDQHYDVSEIYEHAFDARKYGFSMAESSILRLNKENIGEYITTWEAYQPRLMQTPYFMMADDKYVFSMTFGKYIDTPETYAIIQNGEIVSVDEEINVDNIYDILLSKNGGVIKDRCGYNGYNIYVFEEKEGVLLYKGEYISKERMLNIVKGFKHGIIQSSIVQGKFENEIFSQSVNTVRIISMKRKDKDYHEIIAAVQRIGTKRCAPVDNFSQGGGSCPINIETGEIGAMSCIDSFDESGKRIYFDTHPDTGVQIKGRIIPNWDDVKKEIIEVTKKLPYFPIIAWDVAIKDEGIAVIEVNMKSSLNIFQIHGGMRNELLGQKYREHGYIKE